MRFIYKLLLGLILFNAMILIFASYFPSSPYTGKNITTDPTYSSFRNIGSTEMIKDMIITSGGIFAVMIAIGVLTQNRVIWVGAGSLVALIAGLWRGMSGTLMPMVSQNSIVNQFYNILIISIGILAVISIIEILTGQQGAD